MGVTESECLDITLENQSSCHRLMTCGAETNTIPYQDNFQLDFRLPADCYRESDSGTENFFNEPQMIDGNLIKFSDDVFGVIFLELYSLALFRRVTEIL